MRILILNYRDPFQLDAGGSERYVRRVAECWAEKGHDVTLFVPDSAGTPKLDQVDGVTYERRGTMHTVFRAARCYLREHAMQFDVVLEVVNARPFYARQIAGSKVTVLIHQTFHETWNREFRFPVSFIGRHVLEPYWLRRTASNRVVSVSESTSSDLARYGIRAFGIVPPAVDVPDVVRERPRQRRPAYATPRFVFIGRLIRAKRPMDAVVAFTRIHSVFPGATLDVIGHGYELEDMLRLRVPGLTVHGRLSDGAKHRVLAKSDIMLVTSTREGWGIVTTEAACHGVPVVAYNVAGLRDSVIDGETGILTAIDPGAMAKAAIELLNDPERWASLSTLAWSRARTSTWQERAAELLALATAEDPVAQPVRRLSRVAVYATALAAGPAGMVLAAVPAPAGRALAGATAAGDATPTVMPLTPSETDSVTSRPAWLRVDARPAAKRRDVAHRDHHHRRYRRILATTLALGAASWIGTMTALHWLAPARDQRGATAAAATAQGADARARGDLQGCVTHYGDALAAAPDSVVALAGRASCEARLEDASGAASDLSQALSLSPNDPALELDRASAYAALGNVSSAAAGWRHVITMSQASAQACAAAAAGLLSAHFVQAAQTSVDAALGRYPGDWHLLDVRGKVLTQLGRPSEAAAAFGAAYDAAAGADRVQVLYDSALFHLSRGEPDAAVADVDRGIAIDRWNYGLFEVRARADEARGDLAAADADYGTALTDSTIFPNTPFTKIVLLRERGYIRIKEQDTTGALTDFHNALSLVSSSDDVSAAVVGRDISAAQSAAQLRSTTVWPR